MSGSSRSSIRSYYTNGIPKRKSRRIAGLLSELNLLRELGRVGYADGFLKKLKIWCGLLLWDSDAEQPSFPEPKFIINGCSLGIWNAKQNVPSFQWLGSHTSTGQRSFYRTGKNVVRKPRKNDRRSPTLSLNFHITSM
jgi:hypothetical protein